jgi:hypothetical protein
LKVVHLPFNEVSPDCLGPLAQVYCAPRLQQTFFLSGVWCRANTKELATLAGLQCRGRLLQFVSPPFLTPREFPANL